MISKIFAFISIAALFAACTKEETINEGIHGSWLQTEVYGGYANGGNFQWNKLGPQEAATLVLDKDGTYNKKRSSSSCTGTFVFTGDSLSVNSNCNPAIMNYRVSHLSGSEMIIDYQVIEGTIREKYVAVAPHCMN